MQVVVLSWFADSWAAPDFFLLWIHQHVSYDILGGKRERVAAVLQTSAAGNRFIPKSGVQRLMHPWSASLELDLKLHLTERWLRTWGAGKHGLRAVLGPMCGHAHRLGVQRGQLLTNSSKVLYSVSMVRALANVSFSDWEVHKL